MSSLSPTDDEALPNITLCIRNAEEYGFVNDEEEQASSSSFTYPCKDYSDIVNEKEREKKLSSEEGSIKPIKFKRVSSFTSLARVPSLLSIPKHDRKKKKKKSSNFHYRSRSTKVEYADLDVQDESSLKPSNPPKRLTPWINYEGFQWTWFLTLCTLAIVDRFSWNVWPRQIYSIGAGSAGSDRLVGYKPGAYIFPICLFSLRK